MLKHFTGYFLFGILLTAPSVYAQDGAIALLNKMHHALRELNYKGTLAYVKENSLSSLRVEHTVVNGVEVERVVRLNEEGNEISRELEGFSLASIPKVRPEMKAVYSFDMGRLNRVANIPCRIITARPKDRERYLQKYCIDSSTGMLLDYMLVGKSHKPVEQFMFTSIEIKVPNKEVAAENQPANSANGSSTEVITQEAPMLNAKKTMITSAALHAKKSAGLNPQQVMNEDLDDGWVMEALPAGFEISHAPPMENDNEAATKHYIFSDGLSSLSVFVSPITSTTQLGAVKINSGALNVVTQQKNNSIITVVGEVPENTLKNIINNLRKK